MIKYKKKRDMSRSRPATNGLSIYPTFNEGDPTAGVTIVRFFNQHGDYLGWCDAEAAKKFFYGKLYYKTKGAFTIKTRRSYNDRSVRKIYIYEKATGMLAAYAVQRALTEADFIDTSDKRTIAMVTRDSFKTMQLTPWSLDSFSDPYNVVPKEIRVKFRNDLANFIELKRNELIAICQSQIDACEALTQASEEAGVNLDI